MLLIAFSSIGVNIVSTFCGGCDNEHVSVTIVPLPEKAPCSCCESNNLVDSCCSIPETSECDHKHETSLHFAKLEFDSTEAKSNELKMNAPLLFLPMFVLFNAIGPEDGLKSTLNTFNHVPFSKGGREILSLHKVLLI
jgi:hypothetical protein